MRFQQAVPRAAGRRAVLDMNFQMVVQILADPGKVMADGDAVGLQLFCGTDPRQHQDLRRLHRARRKNHLGIATGFLLGAVPDEGRTCDPAAFDQQAATDVLRVFAGAWPALGPHGASERWHYVGILNDPTSVGVFALRERELLPGTIVIDAVHQVGS